MSMPICEMTLFHSCKSLKVTFLEMTLHKRWFVDTQRAMTEIIYEDDDIWQLCTMQGYCFVIIEQFKVISVDFLNLHSLPWESTFYWCNYQVWSWKVAEYWIQ